MPRLPMSSCITASLSGPLPPRVIVGWAEPPWFLDSENLTFIRAGRALKGQVEKSPRVTAGNMKARDPRGVGSCTRARSQVPSTPARVVSSPRVRSARAWVLWEGFPGCVRTDPLRAQAEREQQTPLRSGQWTRGPGTASL